MSTRKHITATIDGISAITSQLVVTGRFSYDESYVSFLKGTTETEDTIRIVGLFFDRLKRYIVVQKGKTALNIADIGCYDGSTALSYLKTIKHKLGFYYTGIDVSKTALIKAKQLFMSSDIIKDSVLINGDAFDGKIKQRKEFSNTPFDVIFVSHSAYYMGREETSDPLLKFASFMLDISNLLSRNGVAIFLHGNSFYPLRKKYVGYGARDTTELLTQGASLVHLNKLKVIKFTSKLSFVKTENSLWEIIKDPSKYESCKFNPAFVDTLEKVSFIINCSLIELKKEGILSSFIDEIRDIIRSNGNAFPIVSFLQVITPSNSSPVHNAANRALQEVKDITTRAENSKNKVVSGGEGCLS